MFLRSMVALSTFALLACAPPDVWYGGRATGSPSATAPIVNRDGSIAPAIDYAAVKSQIFSRRCTSCHGSSGGVNLQSYANVKSHLGAVRQEVVSGNMPPSRPLSAADTDLLVKWIDVGAPETATGLP